MDGVHLIRCPAWLGIGMGALSARMALDWKTERFIGFPALWSR